MSMREFREEGYLQELNRCFLHPLGLALAVIVDEETGEETGEVVIYDVRDDPGGIAFHPEVIDDEFREKASNVLAKMLERSEERTQALGFIIQPVAND